MDKVAAVLKIQKLESIKCVSMHVYILVVSTFLLLFLSSMCVSACYCSVSEVSVSVLVAMWSIGLCGLTLSSMSRLVQILFSKFLFQ